MVVGRATRPLADAVLEFEGRASRYWSSEVIEVRAGCKGRASPARVAEAEAQRLLGRIPDRFECVALTRRGRKSSSEELAGYLANLALRSVPGVVFVIGGAYGLSAAVRARAARTMSLSTLTLPHQLARLVLAEQLYRAGTILRNEPYHKTEGSG